MQLNASAYVMRWNNVQLALFDPSQLGNTTFDINGPSYTVKGGELQVVTRPFDGLTVQGSGSYNHSEQTNAPCLSSSGVTSSTPNNPTAAGTCITQVNGKPFTNPYGVLGTTPAFSPLFEFNLRARYDWTVNEYRPFVMVGANHVGSMRNEPASFPPGNLPTSQGGCLANGIPNTTLCLYTMPAYTTYDGSFGVSKDNWTVQATGSNLSNSNASQYTSSEPVHRVRTWPATSAAF